LNGTKNAKQNQHARNTSHAAPMQNNPMTKERNLKA